MKRNDPRQKLLSIEAQEIRELLGKRMSAKPGPCSKDIRTWWEVEALPLLKDNALSQLRRNDEFKPTLLSFMDQGGMGIVDVEDAMNLPQGWGDAQSKDITAHIHQLSAFLPGVKASVFCVEAWFLKEVAGGKDEWDRQTKHGIADHPDKSECMMFNMMHYDEDSHTLMQLVTMCEVLKVLGQQRTRKTWESTVYGEYMTIQDVNEGKKDQRMVGRFVYTGPDDDK